MRAHLTGEFSTLLRDLDSFAFSSGQLDTEKLLQLPHLPAVESLFRGISTRDPGDPPASAIAQKFFNRSSESPPSESNSVNITI